MASQDEHNWLFKKETSAAVGKDGRDGEGGEDDDESDDNSTSEPEITRSDIVTFACLIVATFISWLAFAIMGPFFPREAHRRGVSDVEVGLLFALQSLTTVIMSPIVGKFDSTTNIGKVSRDMKDGSANVVIISDTVALAFKWQQQLQNEGFEICGESVAAGENNARYITAATSERRHYTMRRVVTEEDMVQSILSVFSDAQDQVALAVKEYDVIQDETEQFGRVPRRLTVGASTSESSASEYDFSDPESAD